MVEEMYIPCSVFDWDCDLDDINTVSELSKKLEYIKTLEINKPFYLNGKLFIFLHFYVDMDWQFCFKVISWDSETKYLTFNIFWLVEADLWKVTEEDEINFYKSIIRNFSKLNCNYEYTKKLKEDLENRYKFSEREVYKDYY